MPRLDRTVPKKAGNKTNKARSRGERCIGFPEIIKAKRVVHVPSKLEFRPFETIVEISEAEIASTVRLFQGSVAIAICRQSFLRCSPDSLSRNW